MTYNGTEKKQIGFIFGVATLIYKIICFFMYAGSIFEWWGGAVIIYFAFYFTSVLTIRSSLSESDKTKAISTTMIFVSVVLLFIDFLALFGFAMSLNSTPFKEMGIMPFVNLMNLITNAIILAENRASDDAMRIPSEKNYFKVIEIICIAVLCGVFLYINDGKEHAYHGGDPSTNKVVNGTIKYLERVYGEDINIWSSAGPKGDVFEYDDPERPGRNTYVAYLYWKNVQITAYVEVLSNGKLDIYKENFQSRRYSHDLENWLLNHSGDRFGVDINYERFVEGNLTPVTAPKFATFREYFASLPEGETVNIEMSWGDDYLSPVKKDEIIKLANSLPVAIEGSIIVHLTHYINDQDIEEFTSVNIPYAHQSPYFINMEQENESINSHGVITLMSMNPDYLRDEILNSLKDYDFSVYDPELTEIDPSKVVISDYISEYLLKGYDSGYFSFVRYFYPIIYDGKLIAVSRIVDNEYDCHYEILRGDIVESLNEYEFDKLAVFYDTDKVYLYDGERILPLYEYNETIEDRWGKGATLTLEDDDPLTEELETDLDLDLDDMKLIEMSMSL